MDFYVTLKIRPYPCELKQINKLMSVTLTSKIFIWKLVLNCLLGNA